jgi:DNA-directed RNA polymerase specialized sigma24 family protein
MPLQGKDPAQQGLLDLDPPSRCALILRDILGCSYQQVAAVLDKPETAADGLIAEARKQFRQQVQIRKKL